MIKFLTISTLAAGLTFGLVGGAEASEDRRKQVEANFAEADGNSDGALTLEEFQKLIDLNASYGIGRAQMVKRTGRYETVFSRLDSNSDGLVTPEEVASLAEGAKP